MLPIDFTVEDESRSADHLECCHIEDPRQYAGTIAKGLHQWNTYAPISFWDNQPAYIQLVVEKIDLKSRKVKGMSEAAKDLINTTKPYKGGNDSLWRLSELNNIDKHRVLLTVASRHHATKFSTFIDPSQTQNLTIIPGGDWSSVLAQSSSGIVEPGFV